MPLTQYSIYLTAGPLIWTGLLIAAGFLWQAQYEVVAKYINPFSKFIVGAIVASYLYRVVTYQPEKLNSKS